MGTRASRRLAVATLLLVCLSAGAAGAATPLRTEKAAAFVASRQLDNGSFPAFSSIGSTADAVAAFVAAGEGQTQVDDAIGYLRRQTRAGNVTGIGTIAKVVMAAVAAGKDPNAFGSHDLVTEITDTQLPSGRFGDATVFDQALATLAMTAVTGGYNLSSFSWLLHGQCPDGGWQYDRPYHAATEGQHCGTPGDPTDYFRSDTNTTSLVVQAIAPSGKGTWEVDPFAYFDATRDASHGGWGYTWGYETTDANSTALVIQAYVSASTVLPTGAAAALRELQYVCGAFAYSWTTAGKRTGRDLGATIGAIQGLTRTPSPVLPGDPLGGVPATTCPA